MQINLLWEKQRIFPSHFSLFHLPIQPEQNQKRHVHFGMKLHAYEVLAEELWQNNLFFYSYSEPKLGSRFRILLCKQNILTNQLKWHIEAQDLYRNIRAPRPNKIQTTFISLLETCLPVLNVRNHQSIPKLIRLA